MGQQRKQAGCAGSSKLGIWLWSSHLACIRSPAVAMSAKGPALSHRTREGQGTRFLCVVKRVFLYCIHC
jgi:hypothetical protein